MAVRTTQEIIDALRESFGESPDDTQLSMLEDVSDTFTDLNEKSGEDWKKGMRKTTRHGGNATLTASAVSLTRNPIHQKMIPSHRND